MKKYKLISIAALTIGLTFAFASSPLQASQSIKAYMGFTKEIDEALAKKIQEKLGIEVKHITLSWGEVSARIRTEAPRFNADMVLSVGTDAAIEGTKRGYYEIYKSPAWNDIDASFKSPDGTYYAVGLFHFLLVGNKEKLAEKGYGMPTSWRELLDPKWKGEIIAPSPRTSGTAFCLNYSFLQLYGEEEGWKFLVALDKNIAHYTKSGAAPAMLVARGEYLLGINTDETIHKLITDGYPIQWVVPVEGVGYEGNYCMILKGTNKLELCKKIIDYLGSKEASEFMASMGYIPPRSGIDSALYGASKPKVIKLDHTWAVNNRRKIINNWKIRFLMKETAKARTIGDEKEAVEKKKKW